MKLFDYRIIPSQLEYKSAPSVDQKISVPLVNNGNLLTEFDRIKTVNLAQVYFDERQQSTIFRPTFQVGYIYKNQYLGTTNYAPFQNNLYYYLPELSVLNNSWSGFPQFYEFDFFRPNTNDGHFIYEGKSAYTYNWQYYVSYPYRNNYKKLLSSSLNNASFTWIAEKGIPFKINNIEQDGNKLISFECVAPHGLTVAESVELSFSYNGNQFVFEVYSLGNDTFGSGAFVFNIYNIGYTGNTFYNGRIGTFKRIISPDSPVETRSEYYVRQNKILTNIQDAIITKTGFQKNAFFDKSQLTLSSITPNRITRISKKDSSNAYTITFKRDLDLSILLDNQKRPLSEIYLTIINKGYSGYFNKPLNNVGLKQGWFFNITETNNSWWDDNNSFSNSNIQVSSYTLTDINNVTKIFYYNQNLNIDDVIDGDFCEWNDYEQVERVISSYHHKLKFNQNNFQTTPGQTTNADGYYYKPHHPMTIRTYSNTVETGSVNNVDQVPTYSFFSNANQEFRWRDLYLYGFIDELGRGVDYPYLNNAHYPFGNVIFRLFPEGNYTNDFITGINIPEDPIIDGCE